MHMIERYLFWEKDKCFFDHEAFCCEQAMDLSFREGDIIRWIDPESGQPRFGKLRSCDVNNDIFLVLPYQLPIRNKGNNENK